ncbi:hypothetical protein DL96DRAFT_1578642 [Flagelloscypha sp. PMI_526]|nr:hypothetical protein DL96DRAFT_1578642 [Flagelloscypha sp. PMI_526]
MSARLATSISSFSSSGSSGTSANFYETIVSSQALEPEASLPVVYKNLSFRPLFRPSPSYPKDTAFPFLKFTPEHPRKVKISPKAVTSSDCIDLLTTNKLRVQIFDSEDVDRWLSENANAKVLRNLHKHGALGPLSSMFDAKTPSMALFIPSNILSKVMRVVQKLANQSGLVVTVQPLSALPGTESSSATPLSSLPLVHSQGGVDIQNCIQKGEEASSPSQLTTGNSQTPEQDPPAQTYVTCSENKTDLPVNATSSPIVHNVILNVGLEGESSEHNKLSITWEYMFYASPGPKPVDLVDDMLMIASEVGARVKMRQSLSKGFEISKVDSQLEFKMENFHDRFYTSFAAHYGFQPVMSRRLRNRRDWEVIFQGLGSSRQSHEFTTRRTSPSHWTSSNPRPLVCAAFGVRLEEEHAPSRTAPVAFKQIHQVFTWAGTKPRGIIIIVEHELLDITATVPVTVEANLRLSCPPLSTSAALPEQTRTKKTFVGPWSRNETATGLFHSQKFSFWKRHPLVPELPICEAATSGWDVSSKRWLGVPWSEIIFDEEHPHDVIIGPEQYVGW